MRRDEMRRPHTDGEVERVARSEARGRHDDELERVAGEVGVRAPHEQLSGELHAGRRDFKLQTVELSRAEHTTSESAGRPPAARHDSTRTRASERLSN